MKFTGRNLLLVRKALDLALTEIHNQTATCPDHLDPEYAERLEALEVQKADVERLVRRIDQSGELVQSPDDDEQEEATSRPRARAGA